MSHAWCEAKLQCNQNSVCSTETKILTSGERMKLQLQDKRLVSEHQAAKLELNAKRYWDLFYKRNETKFFKDRHWTVREFEELSIDGDKSQLPKVVLEVGCGVGNLIFPLIEEHPEMYVYACDLSPRAVEFVKSHPMYNENAAKAFQCDITTDEIVKEVAFESVDIVTLIFVLSAIHPNKFHQTLQNVFNVLKPGGVLLFRDYGLYDMAQLRFKAGHKISENFYMRQDGTRVKTGLWYKWWRNMKQPQLPGVLLLEVCFQHLENQKAARVTVSVAPNTKVGENIINLSAAGAY